MNLDSHTEFTGEMMTVSKEPAAKATNQLPCQVRKGFKK
jgi:hypothetical protein